VRKTIDTNRALEALDREATQCDLLAGQAVRKGDEKNAQRFAGAGSLALSLAAAIRADNWPTPAKEQEAENLMAGLDKAAKAAEKAVEDAKAGAKEPAAVDGGKAKDDGKGAAQ